jgi:hypothetical protein
MSDREGPYQGKWTGLDPLHVAVGLAEPQACRQALRDCSPYGCFDMSGNGREWTRNVVPEASFVPLKSPQPKHFVLLRGRRFDAKSPLNYSEIQDYQTAASTRDVAGYLAEDPDDPNRAIGFRVVLEH